MYALLLGAILCFFYDIIRVTRLLGANSFFAVFTGDILFWLLSALSTFIFLIATTNGEIRGYVILSSVIGFLLYRFTIGRIVFFSLKTILGFVKRVTIKASDKTAKICYVAERYTNKMFAKLIYYCKVILISVKKLLKNMCRMVYTNRRK